MKPNYNSKRLDFWAKESVKVLVEDDDIIDPKFDEPFASLAIAEQGFNAAQGRHRWIPSMPRFG